MTLTNEQYFYFISLVHGEELLWNIGSADFRNTEKKKKVWENVGAEFEISGNDAYKTFKGLRDKYRKEKEKQKKSPRSGSSRASNWPYMDHLRFLEESRKKRRAYTSPNWEDKSNLGFNDSNNVRSSSPIQITYNLLTENSGSQQQSMRPNPNTSAEQTSSPRNENNLRTCLENVLAENTSNLVNALKSAMSPPNATAATKPFSSFAEYVRQFMEDIDPEDAKKAEMEILKIIIKFKNKSE